MTTLFKIHDAKSNDIHYVNIEAVRSIKLHDTGLVFYFDVPDIRADMPRERAELAMEVVRGLVEILRMEREE